MADVAKASPERLRTAEAALEHVPEGYRSVGPGDVAEEKRGAGNLHGMFIAWAWGVERGGREYLDFLSDHRHPGMHAERYFVDGRREPIETPGGSRLTSPDPATDAKLEKQFVERNQAAYADLRRRGLLPPGEAGSTYQAVHEFLVTGGEPGVDQAYQTELDRFDNGEVLLGGGWDAELTDELAKPDVRKLLEFIAQERSEHLVFPPADRTFRAFELTPFDHVKAVILGQDPYPTPGNAIGLAFAIPDGVQKPDSLRNIYKVLESDLSEEFRRPVAVPDDFNLQSWARHGVMLLNTSLTMNGGSPQGRAHRRAWFPFTDAVIHAVSEKPEPVVFILWGTDANKKRPLIDERKNHVITSSHPAPRGAWRGFMESRPFSETNAYLRSKCIDEIDWLAD